MRYVINEQPRAKMICLTNFSHPKHVKSMPYSLFISMSGHTYYIFYFKYVCESNRSDVYTSINAFQLISNITAANEISSVPTKLHHLTVSHVDMDSTYILISLEEK